MSCIREIREILIPKFQKKWRPIREIKFPRKFDPAKIKTLKVDLCVKYFENSGYDKQKLLELKQKAIDVQNQPSVE